MKPISSGLLNAKVTFQKSVDSDDGYDVPVWVSDFNKWVRFESGSPKESEQSGALLGETHFKVLCHYSSRITANHRIAYRGQFYEILGEPINVNFANTVTQIHVRLISDA